MVKGYQGWGKKIRDNLLLKVTGIAITCLLALTVYIIQDTRAEIVGMREDLTIVRVAIGKIEARLDAHTIAKVTNQKPNEL